MRRRTSGAAAQPPPRRRARYLPGGKHSHSASHRADASIAGSLHTGQSRSPTADRRLRQPGIREGQRQRVEQDAVHEARLQALRAMNQRLDPESEVTDPRTYTPVDARLLVHAKENVVETRWDYKPRIERQGDARLTSVAVTKERLA